jgi:hypothetical protein
MLTEEDIFSLNYTWYASVGDYTKTDLTYPNNDRFVAIAAVAKIFHCVLAGQYIAGLFSSELSLGLLWQYRAAQCFFRHCEGDGWTGESC